MKLHQAHTTGDTRALLEALSSRLRDDHDKGEGKVPYTEEDRIDAMIKKNEDVGTLIKKLNLTT